MKGKKNGELHHEGGPILKKHRQKNVAKADNLGHTGKSWGTFHTWRERLETAGEIYMGGVKGTLGGKAQRSKKGLSKKSGTSKNKEPHLLERGGGTWCGVSRTPRSKKIWRGWGVESFQEKVRVDRQRGGALIR